VKWKCYTFKISPADPGKEILTSFLSELPFEGFDDKDGEILAYTSHEIEEKKITQIMEELSSFSITFSCQDVPDKNWNEVWENEYEPVVIDNQIYIHAPFHEKNTSFPCSLCIRPQMSFGTGHHPTTRLMLQTLLQCDLKGKKLLDFGCGSGILGIFASMRGAGSVIAVDIDPHCLENIKENAELNSCLITGCYLSDEFITDKNKYSFFFDYIVANINKNVIAEHLDLFHSVLKKEGMLLLSGFYTSDIPALTEKLKYYFPQQSIIEKQEENWALLMVCSS